MDRRRRRRRIGATALLTSVIGAFWILSNGIWNDTGIWIDEQVWEDA